jgi:hypothetical protein
MSVINRRRAIAKIVNTTLRTTHHRDKVTRLSGGSTKEEI